MRIFKYPEYDEIGGREVIITEKEILNKYWNWWKEKMIEKYGENHPLITKERCIDDFIVVNWANEIKDE